MEYNKAITDLAIGDAIEGFYLLRSAQSKITSTGKPFLILTLTDRTGAVEGKVWDYAGPIGRADEGKVVKIRGNVGEYRGSVQITVDRIRLAAEGDPVDPASLVPEAPIAQDAAMAEVRRYLASIQDADYRAAAEELLRRHERDFPLIPAAKSVHHGFRMGLLMHTGNMLKIADFLAGLYPEVIDRSLLLAGTFAHDLAKAREFQLSELGLATDYTAAGQLLGHLVMGAQEAAEVTKALGIPEEKGMLLQHLILAHHGEPEFGAAVKPACAEAELLSYIDGIDSRMEICREALAETEAGRFSERIFALDGRRMYRHE